MPPFSELITRPIVAINLGLRVFAQSLESQDVEVCQVDWIPAAGGDEQVAVLLDKLMPGV